VKWNGLTQVERKRLRRLIGRRGVGSALGESDWWRVVRVERRPTLLCPHDATPPLFNPTPTSSAAAPRAPDWREEKSALLHPRHHAPRLHFLQLLLRGWCQYLTRPESIFIQFYNTADAHAQLSHGFQLHYFKAHSSLHKHEPKSPSRPIFAEQKSFS
jgi:hypothetical protein